MRRFLVLTLLPMMAVARFGIAADGERWQVSASSFVSEGRYGSDETTRLVYVPLSLRRMFKKGDVTVVVPYMNIRSDGSVLVFRGLAQPAAPTRREQLRRSTAPPFVQHQITQDSGIGDVAIAGRYFVHEERGGWPAVDLAARAELPTGDEARGLGRGKPSYEIGVEVSKRLGRSFVALAQASYSVVGKPEGADVHDTWEYSVGLGCYVTAPLLVTVSYEQWRPITPGVSVGRDLLGTATLKLGRSVRLLGSAQVPLSEEAPDVGAGLGLGVRF